MHRELYLLAEVCPSVHGETVKKHPEDSPRDNWIVSSPPELQGFGLWEETGDPGRNIQTQGEHTYSENPELSSCAAPFDNH